MTYRYDVPVQMDSPWPTFRRDRRNSGLSPVVARYHGDEPWVFQTGKGVFSTPVIDRQGTIYIGSADHFLYALCPDGTVKWRFETGEIIDSAAALPRIDPLSGVSTVLVPSGDGYLYCLDTRDGRVIWAFDACSVSSESYNNWWEANVAIGPDGTIYAGNTNFNYYALTPGGTLKWSYRTGANAWSQAAIGDDGSLYWGSCDTKIRSVSAGGTERWSRRTLGFVSSSAAIGSDGTIYIGSFDGALRALDPNSGQVKWVFKTGDHIYGSAALASDDQGATSAIYIGSTDGCLYSLCSDGSLRWAYDTGSPIRSSPVIGCSGDDSTDQIAYFGSGCAKENPDYSERCRGTPQLLRAFRVAVMENRSYTNIPFCG